jgi:hypothetical protein
MGKSGTDVAREAAELVIRIEDGGLLLVEVNGNTIEHGATKENVSFQGNVDSYWSKGWEIVPVPVEYLREGRNEVVLRDGEIVVFEIQV